MPFHPPSYIPSNMERMPFQTTPQNRPYRVAFVYKNFGRTPSGHIGLGVTALQHVKYLQAKGIYCDVWGILTLDDLKAKIILARTEPPNIHPLTHVVISAPFIAAEDMQDIAILNPSLDFAVVSHSNVGFLAADPNAFKLIREYAHVEAQVPNFHLAGNSCRLGAWFQSTYGMPCWTLPNLYYLDATTSQPHRPHFNTGDTLRVGCFGAQRILKNILSAGAGALQIAAQLRVDLEFWISGGRVEGPQGTRAALEQMYSGVKWARVIENAWEPWSQFRQTVKNMDLLMQVSYTESFNVVTADGVAGGVPSVVSRAITWAPESWKADGDDPDDIARVGEALLTSRNAPMDGLNALTRHNEEGFKQWVAYLTSTTPHL